MSITCHGLDFSGVSDVGTPTQVNEGTAPVHGGGGRLDPLVEDPDLEGVVLEHLQQVFLGHLKPFERLFLLDNLLHHVLKYLEVRLQNPVK